MRFSQKTYSVDENDGPVHAVLILSNPSSADIAVEIIDSESSATSK